MSELRERRGLKARTTAIVNTRARLAAEYQRFQNFRRNGCPRCGYRPDNPKENHHEAH